MGVLQPDATFQGVETLLASGRCEGEMLKLSLGNVNVGKPVGPYN
jgi:hypothetical protein